MIKARPIILIVTVFILCFFPVTSMAENEPGTIKWKYPLQESPVRTPAIGHNNIIYLPMANKLLAIDSSLIKVGEDKVVSNPEESLIWSFEAENNIESLSIDKNNRIYFSAQKKAYALDSNGNELWRYPPGEEELGRPGLVSDIVSIDHNNNLYFHGYSQTEYGNIRGLHSVDVNGNKRWTIPDNYNIYYNAEIPAIGGDNTLYSRYGYVQYALAKINSENGSILNKSEFSYDRGEYTPPSIGVNGQIYLNGESYLDAFSPEDAGLLWSYNHKGSSHTHPWQAVIGNDGTIYFSSYNAFSYEAYTYAIYPDGTEKWIYPIPFTPSGHTNYPTGSPVIGNSGFIYVVAHGGIIALNSEVSNPNKEGEPVWIVESEDWALQKYGDYYRSPIMGSDGILYVYGRERDSYYDSFKYYLYAVHTESTGLANSPWPMEGANAQHTYRVPSVTQQHTLTINIDPQDRGTVTGDGITCPDDCEETYAQDTEVILTATPNDGWKFECWDDGVTCDNQNPLTVMMDEDKEITAKFVEDLLAKYAPILKFTDLTYDFTKEKLGFEPEEKYFPTSVEDMISNSELYGLSKLTPNLFSRITGIEPEELKENYDLAYFDLKDEYQSNWSPKEHVVYGRKLLKNGKTYLQYWFFNIYNDWENEHEGDWEMITIELDENEELQRIGYSSHEGWRWFWAGGEVIVKEEWDKFKEGWQREGTHPIVYVALGSHASYSSGRVVVVPYLPDLIDPWKFDYALGNLKTLKPEDYQLVRIDDSNSEHSKWISIEQLQWGATLPGIRRLGGSPYSPTSDELKWSNPGEWLKEIEDFQQYPLIDRVLSLDKKIQSIESKAQILKLKVTNTFQDVQQEIKTSIDSSIHILETAINWLGSDIDLVLVKPDGTIVDQFTAVTDPNITFASGKTYKSYTIDSPMAGDWIMRITGIDIDPEGEPTLVSAIGETDLTLSLDLDKAVYIPGDIITVSAQLKDDLGPILDATVVTNIQTPINTETLILYDDGLHGDGGSKDGLYANNYVNALEIGGYVFNVDAEGNSNRGEVFSRTAIKGVVVSNDLDNDGMPNTYEEIFDFNMYSFDSGEDSDNDGLTNLEEYEIKTNPQDEDTDGDGLTDAEEIANDTDPTKEDTDDDSIPDNDDNCPRIPNPNQNDSDFDGIGDACDNQPPVAQCQDITVSANNTCQANASIDSGSYDPDEEDTISFSQEPPGPYSLGNTSVTLTVTDPSGLSESCTGTVTVVDTIPPEIGTSVSIDSLWPPNHKMSDVGLSYEVSDTCDPNSNNSIGVTSDEPTATAPGAGGSQHAPDAEITNDNKVYLRAERSGEGDGRVYMIHITATDASGNSASSDTSVKVNLNKKEDAIDSGQNYDATQIN